MISSLNAYGGLSANQLLLLFGANASSPSRGSASNSSAQPTPENLSASRANDPASSIKAILAQSQIGQTTAGGGWSVTDTVEAAYASQMSGSGSISASVTVSSPGAIQQVNEAVSIVNQANMMVQRGNVSSPAIVSANDAINVNISNGIISATAMQGATFPNGLPSLNSIQQALSDIKTQDESTGWNGSTATATTNAKATADAWWNSNINGSFTLVKLPAPDTGIGVGAEGPNYIAFGDGANDWALVMTQNSVSATVSVQSNG